MALEKTHLYRSSIDHSRNCTWWF